jgi:amino acid adenylation domain-containing protein
MATQENAVTAFRLSTQQQRVWSLQAEQSPYRATCLVRLSGPLDTSALRQALRNTVQRHEILRTVFHRQAGLKVPFQIIREDLDYAWETRDVSALDSSEQAPTVQELLEQRDIDLERGPVLQAVLAVAGSNQHWLGFALPALCGDERGLQNLVFELGPAYAAALEGKNLSQDVLQYADIGEWQRELLAGEDARAGIDFWKKALRQLDFGSAASVLQPFESQSPGEFTPANMLIQADAALSASVDSFCARHGLQPVDVLAAAWSLFLSRLSNAANFVLGCVFDGRSFEDLESSVGLLSRTLPVVAAIETQTTFISLAGTTASAMAAARDWQDSFAWSHLETSDTPAESIVLPLSFEYRNAPKVVVYGGVEFGVEGVWACTERFALKLVVERREAGLQLEFAYDASRLERRTVERWSRHFLTLLRAALAHPETAVSRLPLLDAEDREQVLYGWNQTAAEYPRNRCLHELFEEQAARTPERTAVQCGERKLSYEELNRQANRVAHALRSAGVGAGSRVGLCLDRGVEMLVAVLGIGKAGAAYVPLSADQPRARLEQQMGGLAAVVSEEKLQAQLPTFAGPLLRLDSDAALCRRQPETNPQVPLDAENLVYVIYTSGSTGVPKGVGVRHRNLVNYATFMARRLELENYPEGLRFATVSTLSADLGNTCIYPALITGGTVHVVPYEVATDSQQFGRYMEQYAIDVLKIVPTHLGALLETGGGARVLPGKYLITGGETLTRALVEKIEALHPACELINHYGPTETTVGSLTLRLKEYDWKGSRARSIPIGRPIANTRIYILDAGQEPVPVGVLGELYIGGEGVAAGYVDEREKTEERFLRDRFVEDPEARMYRTGDQARYLEDGAVEFVGRGDDQVKIRGFRVELGEIEAVLARYAGVQQAVVLAREDGRGEKRLAAYVVARKDARLDRDGLHQHMAQHLPEYMIPAAVIPLAKLPLTANGKVDRQALPAPEQAAETSGYVAPRTPTEQMVAQIWADVLRLDKVGIHDDFFRVGGHSLSATQVVSRLLPAFHIELPLRTLFEARTVAKLAETIDRACREGQGLLPPALSRVSREGHLALSFGQQRLWVLDQFDPGNPLYNISRVWRFRGPLNVDALKRALNEIIRRHESQRTIFRMHDGDPSQFIMPELVIDLPLHDVSAASEGAEAAARDRAIGLAATPFDLGTGPLLHAQLLRLAQDDHVFQLVSHHIISDAWSAGVFFNELSALYEAFSRGETSPLAELTAQYADFAAWQRKWLQGEVLEKHLAYWRNQLAGVPGIFELPSAKPRTAGHPRRAALEKRTLSPDHSRAVLAFCRQEGVTLFMTLLAAFQSVLARSAGQKQVVVGTDIANRTTQETEKMLGFFVNLLAMKADFNGDPTFRELVSRVREDALGAYAHQDLPFDRLVEELQPERKLDHSPIFQILFVMQNVPNKGRRLAGLEVTGFEMPPPASKYDLGVFVVERPDRLITEWNYDPDRYDREVIIQLARHFETFLVNAVSQPETRISRIEMMDAEEKRLQEEDKARRRQSQLKRLMSIQQESNGTGPDKGL